MEKWARFRQWLRGRRPADKTWILGRIKLNPAASGSLPVASFLAAGCWSWWLLHDWVISALPKDIGWVTRYCPETPSWRFYARTLWKPPSPEHAACILMGRLVAPATSNLLLPRLQTDPPCRRQNLGSPPPELYSTIKRRRPPTGRETTASWERYARGPGYMASGSSEEMLRRP